MKRKFMFQYKHLLHRMFFNAVMLNHYNIRQLGRQNNQGLCLDVGCNDGAWARALVGSSRSASEIFGVDVVHHRLVAASANGVTSVEADAASSLPFQDRTFSFVHSNQVIEHVASVDAFMSELYRVTVPGGHVLISTENASSWVNVGAAALGYQMFSLTNMSSRRAGIGNPFAIHRGEDVELSSWTHKTIFSLRGLIEFTEAHGFNIIKFKAAGYFPLPASLATIDPYHGHFISVLLRRPKSGV
jgi:ubiquinone/menaquinone biosynthesis C-methylase UbiE